MARCVRSPLLVVALLAAILFGVDAAYGRRQLRNAAIERQMADIVGAANAAVRGLRPTFFSGRKLFQNEDCSTYVQGCDLTAVQDDCSANASCLKTIETETSYQQCVCAATCQAQIEVYQCSASYYSCAVKCYAAGNGADGCKDCSEGNLKAGSFYTFCQCTATELSACTTYATDKLNTTLWNDCNHKYFPEWFGPSDKSPFPTTLPSAPAPAVEEPAPAAEEPTPSAEEPTPSEEPTPAPEEPMPSEGPAPVPGPSQSGTPSPSFPVQYGPQLACGYGFQYGYSYGYTYGYSYGGYGYGSNGYGANYGYACQLVPGYAA